MQWTGRSADWKLFCACIGEWQETYIKRLNEQYIEILSRRRFGFWIILLGSLNQRIQEDKKNLGAKMSLRKPDIALTLVNLLNENVISLNDLNGFSKELQENVKQLKTRLVERE
ncbi:MAG: multidrug transporter [Subdoligranulum sp.]